MFFGKVALQAFAAVSALAHPSRRALNKAQIDLNELPDGQPSKVSKREIVSENWCGPVTTSKNITSVEATWVVPSVRIPHGGSRSEQYVFYQWVGIDGTNDCPVLLQAGTGHMISNGEIRVYSWYEFWPAPPVYPDIKIRSGDQVYVRVDATSETSGQIYILNYSTGEARTYYVSTNHGSLCFNTAEWIAEAPGYIHQPAPLPSFSNFAFQGCKARTSAGTTVNLQGSAPWTIHDYRVNPSRQVCHSRVTSDSDATIYNW